MSERKIAVSTHCRGWKHKRKPLLLHRGSCGRGKARGNVFRRLCCVPCESCGRSQPKLGVPANLPNRNACRQSEPEMMVWHHSQRQRLRYRRTIPVVPQLGHIWGGVTADWWASTGGFDAAVRDGFGKGGASFFAGEGDGGAAWEDAAGRNAV